MDDSGNGEKVAEATNPVTTVASSVPSAPKGKRNTSGTKKGKKPEEQIGPREALELLQSALSYCQRAGLVVAYGNRAGKLIINIHGAQYDPIQPDYKFVPVLSHEGK